MDIKLELLKNYISDFINNNLEDFEIDASQIADTLAINMLREIQSIITDEECSDFEAVEKIVCLFENNNIDFGFRHDFLYITFTIQKRAVKNLFFYSSLIYISLNNLKHCFLVAFLNYCNYNFI